LPSIRLLARFTKHLLLALSTLFFAAMAGAAVCDGMLGEDGVDAAKINVVTSVKVNGLEWTKTATDQQWHKAFGKKGVVTNVVHHEDFGGDEMCQCQPYDETTISYPDKTVRLLTSFGTPSIDWKRNFKDSLVVGGHIIKPNLSFKAFQKMFPLSAKKSLAALAPGWARWQSYTQTYIVEVNPSEGANCLERVVEFTFSKGKLSHLALGYYSSWCSC
jgi:hypothetical protein